LLKRYDKAVATTRKKISPAGILESTKAKKAKLLKNLQGQIDLKLRK
jgi:hypothetical protein